MKAALVLAAAVTAALGALGALAGPATAGPAGCMATVGISPWRPAGLVGTPWVMTIRVLRHGRTPVPDARPVVRIRKAGARSISFRGQKTGRVGWYRARIVFPEAGTYALSVYDGYPIAECARVHTFRAVVVTDG